MASGFSIIITGMDEIVAKYGAEKSTAAVRTALDDTAKFTAGLVRTRVGKHTITGFLRSSIVGAAVSDKDGNVMAQQGGGVYYAPWVERGTGIYGPHNTPIVPVSAKAMAWHPKTATGKPMKNSSNVVRYSVKGQQPVGMFSETLAQDRTKITNYFASSFAKQFNGA